MYRIANSNMIDVLTFAQAVPLCDQREFFVHSHKDLTKKLVKLKKNYSISGLLINCTIVYYFKKNPNMNANRYVERNH